MSATIPAETVQTLLTTSRHLQAVIARCENNVGPGKPREVHVRHAQDRKKVLALSKALAETLQALLTTDEEEPFSDDHH